MALDPSIPLGIRMPQIDSPMQTIGSLMQLQGMQQQLRADQMKFQQQDRALRADRAVREAIQRRAGDMDLALTDLETSGFGPEALKLRTDLYEQRTKRAEQMTKSAEAVQARFALAANGAYAVKDEDSFRQWKAYVVPTLAPLLGGEENIAQQIGDHYDSDRMKQLIAWGVPVKEQAEQQFKAAQDARDAVRLQQEGPSKAADATKKWMEAGSVAFSLAGNQQAWDRARMLGQQLGMPVGILDSFGAQWSPEAQKNAATLGISTEKQADLAGQAEGRAQTKAYQEGQLAIGRERLGIMRKQLAAAQTQPEQMGPVADMVLNDRSVLKELTPTERTRVIKYIATQRGGALENKAVESTLTQLDQIEESLRQVATSHPGFKGAVGAKGPTSLFGVLGAPMAGTDAGDYATQVDTLKSRLTLPTLQFMRGLGHMSDREFGTMSKAASALSRSQSEDAFAAELSLVKDAASAMRARLMGGRGPASGDSAGVVPDPRALSTGSAAPDTSGEVSQLLASQPAGTYTLSDGSVWRKTASGVSKVK